ncbi:MAG: AI-2E family transporter [Candidatus Nitricoxidivorans perseverans]|uniref:AI-2E family transporter n=1 Tax=Candidatus Nitricoxidivorans perseverans TaxID=2975601 RepID=A0AA49J0A9_9PROT|nr:MAG: AI-2E family transporter [Candidatus Nitricoxidivorans perseverans]
MTEMPGSPSPGRRFAPWLALAGLTALAALVMAPFLAPLAWAGVLAYASWPLMVRLRRRCGGRDTLAASLATVLAGLTLIVPLVWLLWLAQNEVGRLYPAMQSFVAAPPELPGWLSGVPWLGDWLAQKRAELLADPQGLIAATKNWFTDHAGEAAALAGGLGKNLAKLALALMILFFFYRDGARMVSELRHVLARFLGPRVNAYLAAIGATTSAVVYGFLLTALAQGALAGLGYWVAGLGSPVMLGVITALFALIPFATPLAWGSAGAWLLLQGETGPAIGVWLWGAAVVSQIDNVLRPMFISSIGDIPFLVVLFGVLGGILAFGLVGLFAGPVVLAVAWAVWREWATHLNEDDGEGGANE